MVLDPDMDKKKSPAKCIEAVNKQCEIPGCTKHLTIYQGSGQDTLCRKHQRELIDRGGYGRLEKKHTFHRADVCKCCGLDIMDDPRWELAAKYFDVEFTDKQIHEIKRRNMHGDHEITRADGGDDSEENTNAYCTFCHWVKTVISGDGLRRDSLKE